MTTDQQLKQTERQLRLTQWALVFGFMILLCAIFAVAAMVPEFRPRVIEMVRVAAPTPTAPAIKTPVVVATTQPPTTQPKRRTIDEILAAVNLNEKEREQFDRSNDMEAMYSDSAGYDELERKALFSHELTSNERFRIIEHMVLRQQYFLKLRGKDTVRFDDLIDEINKNQETLFNAHNALVKSFNDAITAISAKIDSMDQMATKADRDRFNQQIREEMRQSQADLDRKNYQQQMQDKADDANMTQWRMLHDQEQRPNN